MLELISIDGKLQNKSHGSHDSSDVNLAIKKCLRYIRNVIQLDCRFSTIDTDSDLYKLLMAFSKDKTYIPINQKIYLPIYHNGMSSIWGFIEVSTKSNLPTMAQIKKSLQAIKDIIEPEIFEVFQFLTPHAKFKSLLILKGDLSRAHRLASNLFYNKKFTSFINLSEINHNEQAYSLSNLKGYEDSLLFVGEILDLTSDVRRSLADFQNIYAENNDTTLIICTKSSNFEIEKILQEETYFLNTFKDRKILFRDNLEKKLTQVSV